MCRSEPHTPRRLDPHDRVAGVEQLRLGDLLDEHLAGGLEGDGTHRAPTLENGDA